MMDPEERSRMRKDTALTFDYNSFKWSVDEYSLKELLDNLGDFLPFVMVVTQGYAGKTDVGADEVYFVHDITHQDRVVGKDSKDDYFSIPYSYEKEVIPTTHNGVECPKMTVANMANSSLYRSFRFPDGTQHRIMRDANELDTIELDTMELTRTYSERFLVVHSVLGEPMELPLDKYRRGGSNRFVQEGLHPRFELMPVYMPIAVAVALDVSTKETENFHRLMYDFNTYVKKQEHSYQEALQGLADIIVFEEEPSDGDYEYIHFMQMVNYNSNSQVQDDKSEINDVTRSPRQSASVTGFQPDNPPTRPPKTGMSTTVNPKGLQRKHRKPKKNEMPPKVPGKDPLPVKERKHDSGYELVETWKPYSNVTKTKLDNRVGPIAIDMDPREALSKLQQILSSEKPPKSTRKEKKPKPKTKPDKPRAPAQSVPTGPAPNPPPRDRIPPDNSNPYTRDPTRLVKSKPPPPNPSTIRPPVEQVTSRPGIQQPHGSTTHHKANPQPADRPQPGASIQPSRRNSSKTGGDCLTGITDVSEIPQSIEAFTVSDVGICLDLLNMSSFKAVFKEHQVDGELLKDLDEGILTTQFKLDRLSAKKVVKFSKGWRPKV